MKHTLLLPMLAALLLFGCTKDNDPPPEPPDRCPWPEVTTEGKNTLAFKINGVEWVPCVDLSAAIAGLKPVSAGFTEDLNGLTITGSYFMWAYGDSIHHFYNISFYPLYEGKIDIQNMEHCRFDFRESFKGIFHDKWTLPESRDGLEIEILRLDEEQNIISGKFEAILIPKIGNDTLFITEGRFDVTYTPR